MTHWNTSKKIAARFTFTVFAATLTSGAQAENGLKRYPVTEQMVVSAMQGRQLPTAGVQLRLSAPITALSANPRLEIQSISLTGTSAAELKVACSNRADCTPFYVAAAWPESAPTAALAEKAPVSAPISSTPTTDEASIHRGGHATLLIEDDRIHIQLRVVTLEAGAPGDTIRVTTPDHRQSFTAEVLTPTLLKGSF